MCTNFMDPRSSDRELTLKKTLKMAIFGLKIYYFAYTGNLKTTWRVKLKFVLNVSAYK